MVRATLCFLRTPKGIYLSRKKRGFGADKYNGYGGKTQEGESTVACVRRELKDEAGVEVGSLEHVARLTYEFPENPKWNHEVEVFVCDDWTGEFQESEEMAAPEHFAYAQIPYDKMWDNDKYWLPLVLEGKKVKGFIRQTQKETLSRDIHLVDKL